MSKVWFITGAGRGLGIDIAQKALAADLRRRDRTQCGPGAPGRGRTTTC